MEIWKANCEWNKGTCAFVKQILTEDMTQAHKDHLEEEMLDGVCHMLGYPPEGWQVSWEQSQHG